MHTLPFLRGAAAAAVALALTGCAAPGFDPLDSSSSPDESADAGRGRPRLVAITPELVREMAARLPTGVPAEVQQLFGTAPAYTIGPGDVIGIVVYRHPELLPNAGAVIAQQSDPTGVSAAPGFIVDSQGEISFPYVGRVRVEGLSESAASDLIARRIEPFIRDPLVSIRVQAFRSRRAYVEGDVRTPGLQIFTDVPMTLAEALSRAGSLNASADRSRVTLTRGGRSLLIDLLALQRSGYSAARIPLENGDIVRVDTREDSRVYVMGEIQRPSALPLRNGRLTLNEALGDAGGPALQTAAPGQIYVVRNTQADVPDVYHLDAKNPVALALADRFELQPRDVVYIDPVPLVRWNRVISLILPAAQIVNPGGVVIRR
ncbi:polysaccharide biosynthesis/export family protein [Xylophilus sp.]|uniref:polysaccharide biosynthesis/export family protein n=1 Tax=Xylophilus sp. TaxID=2653893 RepID=UPI0013B6B5A0|nr:polysaccharide biosynthesis/export family protein [Xylophilus sp.]KAF1048059.1 MAG: hypothetical protein GAK38_01530 [Xylophilus sp.]